MSEFTKTLKAFANYSEKLEKKKINWGDFVNLQHYLKEIIGGYHNKNLTNNERKALLEIYYSLGDKTREFLNEKSTDIDK